MMVADPAPFRRNRLRGIGLRVAATLTFGVMAASIKLGHEAGVSLPEMAFYRFAFGLPPLLAWIAWSRNFNAWATGRPMAHFVRGAIGLSTMLFGFSALKYLPLAEATTIGFLAPLFAVILSALVLRERVGRHRWSAVAIGFAGVMIVMRPGGEPLPPIGLAIALIGAFGVGCVTIAIRQIGRTEGTQTTVLRFTILSIVVIGLFMPAYASLHDARTWAILVAIGLSGGIGQIVMTASLRHAPVSVVAPFDYVQLIWAVLFGWLLWDTHPPAATWAGAALIMAGGLYTVYREQRLGRASNAPEAEA